MPEYLAPGVYIEETSYRAKSIEGVSTSTAGFVGPTRTGPTDRKPEVLTSFGAFEATYGGLEDIALGGNPTPNYMAHAARGFFVEGGARLYVMRVAGTGAQQSSAASNGFNATARYSGAAGDMQLSFTLTVGANVLVGAAGSRRLSRLRNHDSVVVLSATGYTICSAERNPQAVWTLRPGTGAPIAVEDAFEVYPLSVVVEVARPTLDARGLPAFAEPVVYGPMSLSPRAPEGIWEVFGSEDDGQSPPVILSPAGPAAAVDTLTTSLYPPPSLIDSTWWLAPQSQIGPPVAPAPASLALQNGLDGAAPTAIQIEGSDTAGTGLAAFEAIEDISIVAAPGSTELADAQGIRQAVIGHCHRMRYRAAVLDVPRAQTVNGARDWRNQTSTTHAAIYHPWITVPNPFFGPDLELPPSGHVAGIWARNDIRRAVFKAPANEVVLSAIDLERQLTKGQQDVLNPEGVNCLRFFPGRGNLVWGARTMTDDPEWKYISVRRYFNYLEHSIDKGTQWAVFEPNGEALWANVRRTIEDFMVSEWKSGAMLGTTPEDAFFVRCDRTTMTQNDLDNGRLVCLIGAAVVKPAEYVIFRIGQWTASAA